MITELDLRSSSRNSLGVRRYHAWPMLQRQDVAAHTAQMMRIWWCVWGPMSPEVSTTILWHDAGEGDAGDAQFSAKRRYPDLKKALDECEGDHMELLLFTDAPKTHLQRNPDTERPVYIHPALLTPRDRWRVKAVDLVEGYEHALTDVAMGNRLAVPVVDAYAGGMRQHFAAGDQEDLAALDHYLLRPWSRRLVAICEAARRDTAYEGEAEEAPGGSSWK